jgi:hypothetical protein
MIFFIHYFPRPISRDVQLILNFELVDNFDDSLLLRMLSLVCFSHCSAESFQFLIWKIPISVTNRLHGSFLAACNYVNIGSLINNY